MKAFMVIALAALAHARPEPPSGYNYQRPQLQPQPQPFPQPLPQPLPQYNQPNFNVDSSQQIYRPELSISSGSFGSSSGSQGSFIQQQQQIPQQQLAPIIQKHIYVHVPPPEPIEEQKHFVSQALAPRKNYKIIFIKAPTAPAISQQVLQQQQQVQEKTIVYVLVKKPDEQEALTLSGFAPTKPSKPEVYFIKYKTQKDSTGGGIGSGSANVGFNTGLDISSGHGSGNIGSISNVISSGSSQTSIGSTGPSANYGPPGGSGPY